MARPDSRQQDRHFELAREQPLGEPEHCVVVFERPAGFPEKAHASPPWTYANCSVVLREQGEGFSMALNIKNPQVEQLAAEVARMAGETKTEAIRRALIERKARLQARSGHGNRKQRLIEYMAREVWPQIPPDQLGKALTREEEDEILGYGPDGV